MEQRAEKLTNDKRAQNCWPKPSDETLVADNPHCPSSASRPVLYKAKGLVNGALLVA